MHCPTCGTRAPEGSRFCETDGTRLAAASPVALGTRNGHGCRCGAGPEAIDEEGFCTQCGRQQPPRPDHEEEAPHSTMGAVTDRGQRYAENQDACALAMTTTPDGQPARVIVVCDGLSSAEGASLASRAAADAARDDLLEAVEKQTDATEAIRAAIDAAQKAVLALNITPTGDKDFPSTTIVAALVRGTEGVVGWVGDSRAYWIAPTDAAQITRDHSWVNEIVDSGELTLEQALRHPHRAAITRCLGAGEKETPASDVAPLVMPDDATLLVCSDGLWRYAMETSALADLLRSQPAEATPLEVARTLVEFANSRGGADNITAAVVRFPERGASSAPPTDGPDVLETPQEREGPAS